MRILILNDDNHENKYCFENGVRADAFEVLEVLAPAHTVNYDYNLLYLTDAQDKVNESKFYSAEEEEENNDRMVELFNVVMWDDVVDYECYIAVFNELWELAE